MPDGPELGGDPSAVTTAEAGEGTDGHSTSPILGTSVELVTGGAFHEPTDVVEAHPGPRDYTNHPGFQESFVA